MASEHEKLRDDLARKLGKVVMSISPDDDWTKPAADAAIAFIAERTKEATDEMCLTAIEQDNLKGDWSAMHAASALWPSHGTDGIGER